VVVPSRPKSEPITRVARCMTEIQLTQNSSGAPTLSTPSGLTYFNLSGLLQQTQSWSSLSGQYDQFRVRSVEVDYLPYGSKQGSIDQQVTAPMGWAYDVDTVSPGTPSALAIVDYAQAKVVDLYSKWNIRYEIPGMSFGSTATGYAFNAKWFDTATPNQVAGCWRFASVIPTGSNAVPFGGTSAQWTTGVLVWSLTMEYLQAI
jgi:hypothetical protein